MLRWRLNCYSSFDFVAMIYPDKSIFKGERKGLFGLVFRVKVHCCRRNQGRNSKQLLTFTVKTRKGMNAWMLTAQLASLLLYKAGPKSRKWYTTHLQASYSHKIISHRHAHRVIWSRQSCCGLQDCAVRFQFTNQVNPPEKYIMKEVGQDERR